MTAEKILNDTLTGLFTRKTFEDRFKVVMEACRKADLPAVLIYIDIDAFLEVNETYGHLAGDAVISAIGGLIRKAFGSEAIAGRFGGDEFAILISNMEREPAFLAVERLRQAVEAQKEYEFDGQKWAIHVTISAGLAAFPVDGRSDYELLRKADQALYRAKLTGRNQVRLAHEEKLVPKTTHFTQTQLERLTALAQRQGVSEAELLREAMDDMLLKYGVDDILS